MHKPGTKQAGVSATPDAPPPPTEAEALHIAEARERVARRRKPVSIAMKKKEGTLEVSPPHSDGDGWLDRLCDAVGTGSQAFALDQFRRLSAMIRTDAAEPGGRISAMLATVEAVRPENEIEGALAVQMAATHHAAMDFLSRAATAGNAKAAESYSTIATKMLRTYTTQLEALAKARRGGAQKVTVEHVHVHSGGQAIVGHVTTGRGRGHDGANRRPHAPSLPLHEPALAATIGETLLRDDEERDALPVADRERKASMPHARRRAR